MKKKLVAVAVAGVLGAPLAAHAQTANVTLYGRLNVDFELVNGRQPDGSNPTVSRLSSNSSRFGIRGIPTLILFKNGVAAAQKVGAMAKGQLTAFIDSNI